MPAKLSHPNIVELLSYTTFAPWYREGYWATEALPFNTGLPRTRFRLEYMEQDADDPDRFDLQCGRWWYVEQDMDAEALLKTAWLAVTVSDEHRRREGFEFKGQRPFNPHSRLRVEGLKFERAMSDVDFPLGERVGG